MMNETTSFAQRSQKKIYFEYQDMDYYLSWILGREIYDGSDRQECMSAAQKIRNADATSWHREWSQLANRVENEAEIALL